MGELIYKCSRNIIADAQLCRGNWKGKRGLFLMEIIKSVQLSKTFRGDRENVYKYYVDNVSNALQLSPPSGALIKSGIIGVEQ